MPKICLVFWKSEPDNSYRRCAYGKICMRIDLYNAFELIKGIISDKRFFNNLIIFVHHCRVDLNIIYKKGRATFAVILSK